MPEDIRWIPATTRAVSSASVLRPGTVVDAGSVILELSNPQLDQELQDATLKLKGAEASLANLRVQLRNDALAQEATTASIERRLQEGGAAGRGERAARRPRGWSPEHDAEAGEARRRISCRRGTRSPRSSWRAMPSRSQSRLAVQQSEVDQTRAIVRLKQQQVDELHVRAGFAGVLQVVPVEVGQQVAPGTNLARVADPSRLKAELKIAGDAGQGHPDRPARLHRHPQRHRRGHASCASIRRCRTARSPSTSTMDGPLPKGARPDLSVDGTVRARAAGRRRRRSAGRPSVRSRAPSACSSCRPTASATRVQVKLGRTSVNEVEIVSGLNAGDQVILSDMSAWDAFDRIRLQ